METKMCAMPSDFGFDGLLISGPAILHSSIFAIDRQTGFMWRAEPSTLLSLSCRLDCGDVVHCRVRYLTILYARIALNQRRQFAYDLRINRGVVSLGIFLSIPEADPDNIVGTWRR